VRAIIVLAVIVSLCDARQSLSATPKPQQRTIARCEYAASEGVNPIGSGCTIFQKRFEVLPSAPIVYRLETFSSLSAARAAETASSTVVQAAGKVWLIAVATKGSRSTMGNFVAEIGPLALKHAAAYELTVGEARFGPDAINLPHTHPGPEAWYLLRGTQCLELANGRTIRAHAGESAAAPADTPMRLTFLDQRDALLMVIGDAARPWSSPSTWKPLNLCESTK